MLRSPPARSPRTHDQNPLLQPCSQRLLKPQGQNPSTYSTPAEQVGTAGGSALAPARVMGVRRSALWLALLGGAVLLR
jgi:hypothetical protein